MFAIRALCVMATLFAMVSAKVVHNNDLEVLQDVKRDGQGSCTIVQIIDYKITVRVCLEDLEGCEFQVYETDGVTTIGETTFVPDTDGVDCIFYTSRRLGRDLDYILRIQCEIENSQDAVMDKPFNSADMLCPRSFVKGEPHWTTFDGLHFSYQGKPDCIYTWIKDNVHDPPLYEIQAVLGLSPMATPTNKLTRVYCIIIITPDHIIKLLFGNLLQIDGGTEQTVNAIIDLPGTDIKIFPGVSTDDSGNTHNELNVVMEGRLWVSYNGFNCAEVIVMDPSCIGDGKQVGLGGDTDDPPDVSDDLTKGSGGGVLPVTRPVPDDTVKEFGDSWEVYCPPVTA